MVAHPSKLSEEKLVEGALNETVAALVPVHPSSRFFIIASMPSQQSTLPDTKVRTDAAHRPKELAAVLRQIADFYDPPKT